MLSGASPPREPTGASAGRGTAAASAGDSGDAGVRLDPAALGRLRQLDPTGANRLLERVSTAFETSAGRLMPQLREAHLSGNHRGVRHVAHTLKSASASVGAMRLSQLCAEVEALMQPESLGAIGDRIEQMESETRLVLAALKQLPDVSP